MIYVLDTNIITAILKGNEKAKKRTQEMDVFMQLDTALREKTKGHSGLTGSEKSRDLIIQLPKFPHLLLNRKDPLLLFR